MKKYIILFGLMFSLLLCVNTVKAQAPDPPTTHDIGGGAPIGGGLFILLGLGAAYGGKKLYDKRKTALDK